MDQSRLIRLRLLHTMTGIFLGLFIYGLALTGSVALFHAELRSWDDPAGNLPHKALQSPRAVIHPIVSAWVAEQAQENSIDFIELERPLKNTPYYKAQLVFQDETGAPVTRTARWNGQTGALLPPYNQGLSDWFLKLHREFMWPNTLGGRDAGRSLVALIGMAALLLLVSGIITHRKYIQDAFTLRFDRSLRLSFTDFHKFLGLWCLPFLSMSVFTGVFLGLTVLIAPIVAFISFKGDKDALLSAIFKRPPAASAIPSEPYDSDKAFLLPNEIGARPFKILVHHWGDQAARYELHYPAVSQLSLEKRQQLDPATGTVLEPEKTSLALSVTNAIAPLHFGAFAGLASKCLYAFMGLLLACLAAFGQIIWLEKRLKTPEAARKPKRYRLISALITGSLTGIPLAILSSFYVTKLIDPFFEGRIQLIALGFFVVWGAAILYAALVNQPKKTAKPFALLSLGLLCGLLVLAFLS